MISKLRMFVLMGVLSSSVATATTTMRILGMGGKYDGRENVPQSGSLPAEISDIGCFHAIYASLASSLFPTHVT